MNQVSIGKRKQCFGCTRKNCTFYFRNDSVFAYANYNGTNWREMKYVYPLYKYGKCELYEKFCVYDP